jgi:DNA-binding transcriptional LysR family regulator
VQFTFTELQVLAGLAEHLTVVEIGEQLSLSHSAISRALHTAQQRAGVQLVEREGRRLRLTLAGQDLAQRAAVAVHEVDEVGRLADAQRAGTSGVVRILASATPADYLLPAVIAEFLAAAPSASVLLRNAPAADETLERFDLRIGPPEPAPAGWRADVLYVDELVFFVAAHHPLARQSRVTWADLQKRTLVGQFLDLYWARYWVGRPNPPALPQSAVDVTTAESVKRVVERIDAIGMAVRSALREGFSSGQFVALPLDEPRVDLPYLLTYRSGVRLLAVVDRFRRVLIEHVSRL